MRIALTRKTLFSVAALCAGLALSGCGGMGKSLGIGKYPPDEFAIVTKAPLVIPPDYSLRPPRPGETRPQETAPRERARAALFGEGRTEDGGFITDGERLILLKARAQDANPSIRTVLNAENGGLMKKDSSFADAILFWSGAPDPDEGDPLDPEAEEERLRYWELARAVLGEGPIEIKRARTLNLPGVR